MTGEEQHKATLKEWALKKNTIKKIYHFQSSIKLILSVTPFQQLVQEITLFCHQEHEYYWQYTVIKLLQKAAEAILCTLFECSVMVMAYYKHITVNTNDMKLILGISAKIRSNYFSPIDAPDHLISAITIHHLHAASTPPTTTATFLPSPSAVRVSTHQMAGIRAPVQFTKPVLEEQKKEEKEEKKRKKKNNNNNEDDDDDN
ncbi:uncharacterized protein CIMG_13115 [Coccidioides immitis RS]|uniref:Histone H3 n=1 Tax=Coccidioides immitis (strain RS) TaxID=246410 RepID=J3K9R2_COCIM|nr:uncharacterized protein CIMG_13115 [Coccidioides immitis RS]EAS31681.3 hypothetical protein CIMG_13115 [Coccidioides immitis RS]